MEILQNAIIRNERFQKIHKKHKYIDSQIISIVEDFIKSKQLVCYGGIAINNILPKSVQFYDYDIDIPDYDFFSPNAMDDAKELCDIFSKLNVYHVESKSAFFVGTYKVFVNFIPIADITQIHPDFYHSLLRDSIKIENIPYTPPKYLRMSFHQELSRPLGDVSRWEKIYKRMQILNTYFPFSNPSFNVKAYNLQNTHKIYTKQTEVAYKSLLRLLVKENTLFCNTKLIARLFNKYIPRRLLSSNERLRKNEELSDEPFICMTTDLNELVKHIKEEYNKSTTNHITIEHNETIYKFIKGNIEIFINNTYVGTIFELDSCMSFHEVSVKLNDKLTPIKIGSIDTLLYLYYAISLIDKTNVNRDEIQYVIFLLNHINVNYEKIASKYNISHFKQGKKNSHIILSRFSLPCIGIQDDYEKILKKRYQKYNELKNRKQSSEYKIWFFKYVPEITQNKRKSKRIKKSNTKKIIFHSNISRKSLRNTKKMKKY